MRYLLLGLCVACSGGPGTDGPCADDTASAFACGGDVALEVGVGVEAYETLPGDGVVELVRGPQGAQHVHFMLKAPWSLDELALDRASISLRVWDGSDEVEGGMTLGQALVADDDGVRTPSLLWVVLDPDGVIGRPLDVYAEIAPVGEDDVARGSATVTVQWAEGEE